MSEPSPKYFEALKLTQHHHDTQNKTFSGQFTWKNRKRIKTIIDRLGVTSILDYGCGKGKQYDTAINRDKDGKSITEFWGITPTMYDPGVRKYAAEPVGKFDLVICVQVLASIPRGDLPWVIDRLYGFANKAIYVSERLVAPHKPIYKTIKNDMPHSMTRDEWMALLRRPGSPVRLIVQFRSLDAKKQVLEPEDQG